jgi:O-antigen/teichoic acid export membrane protein
VVWTAGFVIVAAYGWSTLFAERRAKPYREVEFSWLEAFSIAGLNAAGLVLVQLDRLVIPHVLPVEDLALYGVLAAIVGSLFRVLQMGVGYSLLPRLRAAPDVIARRRLVLREARLVLAIVAAGSAAIWVLTPLVERLFLAGKYHLPPALILAGLITGVFKVLNAFTKSTVGALASTRELSVVNALGWISVVIAVLAAGVGARWGLVGVVYGVGVGWLVRALSALYLTARHLRLDKPVPAVTR